MYGENILVFTNWGKNANSHRFYLPQEKCWINTLNKEDVYKGCQWIKMEIPLCKIPLLIRENATINLGDIKQLYH